jgi:autotransporter-associated beta strand protein
MNKNVSVGLGSIRRQCLFGSIAAAVAAMAILGCGSADAQDEGPARYWLGERSGLWSGQNWATNVTGTTTTNRPSGTDDITFSANGAQNQNTTLGGNFTIRSLTINDPTAVTIGAPGTLTISGSSGTGIAVNSGAGLFTMSANLAWAGGSNTISVNNAAGAVINGVVTGSNGLVKNGGGVLTLTGPNTFAGPVGIGGGALQIVNDNNLGAPSNSVYLYNGAVLRILGNVASSRSLVLDQIPGSQTSSPGGGTIDTNGFSLTWNGGISGSGQLTKAGLGVLTLTGTNSYRGGTVITGGLINFSSLANFGSGNITLNGGGLQWAVGNTADVSGILNPFGSSGATFDTNGNNVTLAGPLGGVGGLTKQGSGALTLLGKET